MAPLALADGCSTSPPIGRVTASSGRTASSRFVIASQTFRPAKARLARQRAQAPPLHQVARPPHQQEAKPQSKGRTASDAAPWVQARSADSATANPEGAMSPSSAAFAATSGSSADVAVASSAIHSGLSPFSAASSALLDG